MSGPFRLPPSAGARFGAWVDRDEPVGFRFAGRSLSGLYGDTLASALLAAGAPRWGASPSLGRPRAIAALGLEDHAPVAIEDDDGDWAAISGDEIVIREGLAARPVRVIPPSSLRGMIRSVALERLRRVLPLPAPKLPLPASPPGMASANCDVVVIGSGAAGLAAASALRALASMSRFWRPPAGRAAHPTCSTRSSPNARSATGPAAPPRRSPTGALSGLAPPSSTSSPARR